MSRVFILARTMREAEEIAHRAKLGRHDFQYLSIFNVRGSRGYPLLMTGDHCWRDGHDYRGNRKAQELHEAITAADMKVTVVPCPPEWGDFQLPEDWDEPRVYPKLKDRVVMHTAGSDACGCGCGRRAAWWLRAWRWIRTRAWS